MALKYQISVVIPVFNESDSLRPLIDRLIPVLESYKKYEIIFVNDGSTDDTEDMIDALHEEYPDIIKSIHLRRNCGKSIALQTGFDVISGDLVIMMDGDLQDGPEAIPNLIKCMNDNNLDVVTGWKFKRFDPISKTLPSRIFNHVVRRFSGLNIHDFNCGLKIIHRKCLENLSLYGQLHRFMLVILANQGFKVGECRVEHSSRKYGYSKYRGHRLFEGLMDFLTIFFITRYLQSPLYFFGFYGLFCFIISFLYTSFFIALHIISLITYYPQGNLNEHPIWILGPVLFIAGMIFISFGLIGELIYHIYTTQLTTNNIHRRVGFPEKIRKKRKK